MSVRRKKSFEERKIERLKKEWTEKTIDNYRKILLLSVRDEFGFGASRSIRLLKRMENVADALSKGYLSMKDIDKVIEEEIGIKFEYN